MNSSQARQQQQQPRRDSSNRDEAGERQICMNVQLSSGSRIARRVCRTEREWARSGELAGRDRLIPVASVS